MTDQPSHPTGGGERERIARIVRDLYRDAVGRGAGVEHPPGAVDRAVDAILALSSPVQGPDLPFVTPEGIDYDKLHTFVSERYPKIIDRLAHSPVQGGSGSASLSVGENVGSEKGGA